MDTSKIPIDSARNNISSKAASSDAIYAYQRRASIQAYRKMSMSSWQKKRYPEQETVSAISKWLTSGNVKLEFYCSENSSEIRVRVVPNDCSETIRDLSLDEFLNMAPVCE